MQNTLAQQVAEQIILGNKTEAMEALKKGATRKPYLAMQRAIDVLNHLAEYDETTGSKLTVSFVFHLGVMVERESN